MTAAPARRFYEAVSVTGEKAPFSVALDKRPLRTPLKRALDLPSRRLAEAIASEWDMQTEKIDPHSMPLTRLANTAIDRVAGDLPRIIGEIVDFAGSDPQVKGPMNAPLSVTASGIYCGLKMAVDPNGLIPPNSGCWRAIEVRAPKGTVVNAEFPAPVVYANHEMSHRVADMVMGALVQFWPQQVMACSQGTSAIMTFGGVDPRSGRRYVSLAGTARIRSGAYRIPTIS